MDLSTELLKSRGFGVYENIDIPLQDLPQFFLVYLADPSDSGKIHNDVKMRWMNGDQQVVDAMNQVCSPVHLLTCVSVYVFPWWLFFCSVEHRYTYVILIEYS